MWDSKMGELKSDINDEFVFCMSRPQHDPKKVAFKKLLSNLYNVLSILKLK